MNKCIFGCLFSLLMMASVCFAEKALQKYQYPLLEGIVSSHSQTYKQIDGKQLQALVFSPPNPQSGEKRPAILFFHGGGWAEGDPGSISDLCRYFASRGWTAVTFQYRLCTKTSTITPAECIKDIMSAIRWVRKNAASLKVDPQKIVASGASAGGHLAACAATLSIFNETGDDLAVSPNPNALVLYFPCVDPTVDPWFAMLAKNQFKLEEASPAHHIVGGLPPTIIFHGTKDPIVPTATIKKFHADMLAKGNACELQIFEGREHVLFANADDYQKIRELTEDFLIRMGFKI
jgi:acetyl esterase